MNINNRNKDLTQIFNDRWNATKNTYNHVNNVHNHDKTMVDSMFNKRVDTESERPKINYMEAELKRLNDNMSSLRNNRNKF